MRIHPRPTIAAAAAVALLSGCATTGALRRATEQQQTALANERAQRIASDSAMHQELEAELGNVRGDVASLRNELQAMRTDLGARITAMEDGLHFAMPVNFAFNDATIRSEDVATLTRFAGVVQKYYPESKVTIEGFADPAGTTRYNLALSRRRADAVRDYLAAHGLAATQLNPVGYGKTRLVTPGASGSQPGAELNRRVVFVIETKGASTVAMR